MYSALAIIIIGAVASVLLGFHFFVPDGDLLMFDSLPSILQPIIEGNAPVILHRPFFEQEMIEAGGPFWPFWYVNDEQIMEILQLLEETLGPVVGPAVPPQVEHPIPPLPLRFFQAAIGYIFRVSPLVMVCLAYWIIEGNIRGKEERKTTKVKQECAKKIAVLDDELKRVDMDLTKSIDERDKKIVELSDSLEQLKKENPRVNELKSLLGQKIEEYLNIKKPMRTLAIRWSKRDRNMLTSTIKSEKRLRRRTRNTRIWKQPCKNSEKRLRRRTKNTRIWKQLYKNEPIKFSTL